MAVTKFIPEILDEINKDPKKINDYKTDEAMDLLFKYAFHPKGKMILPEGDPPYRPDAAPIGMSPAILRQEMRRCYVFCRRDLTAIKREQLFISMLESIHPSEAKVMIAVKDRKLDKMYKKITKKLVQEAGFIPADEPEVKN
jgi:hypothetical protein